MEEKLDKLQKSIDDLTAAVAQGFAHMEETMATKAEMNTGFEQVNGKIDGLHRRMDAEVDQRAEMGVRVSKLEVKVFPELAA